MDEFKYYLALVLSLVAWVMIVMIFIPLFINLGYVLLMIIAFLGGIFGF